MSTATVAPEPGPHSRSGTQVVKAYGSGETRVTALDSVDVEIARGRFTAIMVVRLGQVDADALPGRVGQGDVGSDLHRRLRADRHEDKQLTNLRRTGSVHFPVLQPAADAERVGEHHAADGHRRSQAEKQWLDRVIETVGLSGRLKHRPNQLSGGQQQRVAVARALAAKPEIIFGDEPTGNLDSRAGAEILGFLRRSVDELGQTIVMVTQTDGRRLCGPRALPRRRSHRRRHGEPTAETVLDRMRRFDGRRDS